MKPGLDPGKEFSFDLVVTPDLCPHFDGVLAHPVYATWKAVEHMELAGRKLLVPHLGVDEEGMGVHIRVDHRSPALVGSTVRISAVVLTCTDRRLTCAVTVHCGQRLIAEGEFVQAIVLKDKLAAMLDRYRA